MHIVFETPRLILRRFILEDAPLLLQLNSDPEVIKYVHEAILENEEQAKAILVNIILLQYQNSLGRWAIHAKDNNEFIGWCGLKYLSERNEIDLGYRLHKTSRGKGFATEAALHTVDYGFEKLNLDVITGKAHIENLASINILKKIGMKLTKEGIEDGQPLKIFTITNPGLI